MTEEKRYAIWSHHHRAWWKQDGKGYCSDVNDAGLYLAVDLPQWLTRGCGCCRVPEVPLELPEPILTISPALAQARLDAAIGRATDLRIEAGRTNRYYERSQH